MSQGQDRSESLCSFIHVHCLRPRGCRIRRWSIHNQALLGWGSTSERKVKELHWYDDVRRPAPVVGNPTLTCFRLLAQVSAVTLTDERTNIEDIKTYKSGGCTPPCTIFILSPCMFEEYISSAWLWTITFRGYVMYFWSTPFAGCRKSPHRRIETRPASGIYLSSMPSRG